MPLAAHSQISGRSFSNNAVLRAFEQEIGVEVIRPDIAGMMGAYGAALYAKQMKRHSGPSGILSYEQMKQFTYSIKSVTCHGCNNRCQLTVNDFGGGRRFIGGNRCERPVTNKAQDDSLNLYEYKIKKLAEFPEGEGTIYKKATVAFLLPLPVLSNHIYLCP